VYVKLKAYPVVYFNVVCKKHNCKVVISFAGSTDYQKPDIVAGQIAAVRCQNQGSPPDGGLFDCSDDWQMVISGPGKDIMITN
jgi:hypothetical protein